MKIKPAELLLLLLCLNVSTFGVVSGTLFDKFK